MCHAAFATDVRLFLFVSFRCMNIDKSRLTGPLAQLQLFYHLFSDLAGLFVFKDHFLCAVVRYFFFYEVMVGIIFCKMTVFANTGPASPYFEVHGLPLF